MYRAVSRYFYKHKKIKFLFVQLSFLLFAWLLIRIYWIHGAVASSQDFLFNYQRLEEIWNNIVNWHIPQFNQYTSLPYGLATPTMYPWIFLAPFSYFIKFKRPVQLFLGIYMFVYFCGLNIAFYTYKDSYLSKQSNHRLLSSYFFAYVYVVTGQSVLTLCSSDIGSLYGIILFPLVFFGWMEWIRSNKWLQMMIGLSLISYAHIITTVISILALIILTVSYCFWKHTWLTSRYKSLIKSMGLFMLLSSIIWMPMLCMISMRDMDLAQTLPILKNLRAPHFQYTLSPISTFGLALFPAIGKSWIFSDTACVLLGLVFWKYLPKNMKFYYVVSDIILVVSILFKRDIHSSLSSVISGYVIRDILLPHILLSFIFVYLLIYVIPQFLKYRTPIVLAILFLVLNILNLEGFQDCCYSTLLVNHRFVQQLDQLQMSNTNIHYSGMFQYPLLRNKLLNSQELIHFQSHCDYFPKKYKESYKDSNSIVLSNDKVVIPKFRGNELTFKLSRNEHKVNLPIATYKGQKTNLYMNNKRVPIKLDHNGMIKLTNVHKGTYKVHITESFMWYRWLAVFLTLIGYIILGMIIWNRKKHSKKLEE